VVGLKDEKIVVRVPRNGNEELTVRTGNYWNVDIVDIRWYANGTPTKKGVRMNMKEMKDVAKALNKIIERNKNDNDTIQQDV
tara:strand:+ start:61 stop:306 length:246 start_codon:yes stop_codon:yes gene_type:complete